jgi:hypothetical protein
LFAALVREPAARRLWCSSTVCPSEMDGLRDDADVLFILITNRPEEAEEALASRPGLVGEAIEIANPDAACRSRLVTLYGQALAFEDGAVDATAARSEGRVRPSSRRCSALSCRPPTPRTQATGSRLRRPMLRTEAGGIATVIDRNRSDSPCPDRGRAFARHGSFRTDSAASAGGLRRLSPSSSSDRGCPRHGSGRRGPPR